MKRVLCLIMAVVLMMVSTVNFETTVSAEDASDSNDVSSEAESGDVDSNFYYGSQLEDMDEQTLEIYHELVEYYASDGNKDDFTYTFEEEFVYTSTGKATNDIETDEGISIVISDLEDNNDPEFNKVLKTLLAPAAYAMLMDYPELFWIETFEITAESGMISITKNDDDTTTYTVSQIKFKPQQYDLNSGTEMVYSDASDYIEEFYDAVDDAAEEISSSLEDDADEFTTIKAIHDWLCGELSYSSSSVRTAATVFIGDKYAICEGYAKSFKILCDKFGITSVLVNGSSRNAEGDYEQHMWNDVYIDGRWYGMDVSWDDQGIGVMYIYFLTGNNTDGYFDVYYIDHVADTDYWGDGYFIVEYPELEDDYYDEILTSITSFEVGSLDDQEYSGSEITPEVTVKIMGIILEENEDYTVEYENNVNVGTATVIITGKGRYSGSDEVCFDIYQSELSLLSLKYSSIQYTGSAIEPAVTVTSNRGSTLVEGTDYTIAYSNNVSVGTATVTITGMGNYTGTIKANFEIEAASLSNITLSGLSSCVYTGSAIKPTIKSFVYGNNTLVNGTDFTISYKNNTNVGTASMTIKGIGNYTGSTTATFKITAKSISASSVTASSISDKTYTGSAIKPTVTVKDGTKKLTKGTDYTVTYKNNTKTGKATVTITGKGNYKGSRTVTFNIKPKKISIKTPVSKKKKQITIKWTKTSTVTGYEVQYALNKKFTSSKKTKTVTSYKTSSLTVSGLKSGKTYYVRVRGYKTISGTKKYGAWSSVKKIKVK